MQAASPAFNGFAFAPTLESTSHFWRFEHQLGELGALMLLDQAQFATVEAAPRLKVAHAHQAADAPCAALFCLRRFRIRAHLGAGQSSLVS